MAVLGVLNLSRLKLSKTAIKKDDLKAEYILNIQYETEISIRRLVRNNFV